MTLLFGQYRYRLTPAERAYLQGVGEARAKESVYLGDRGGVEDRDPVARCVLGAVGEFGLCRYLGVPFEPKTFGVDVGGRYEVRTRSVAEWDLLIQKFDLGPRRRDRPFVLVTREEDHEFVIRGWITPGEAERHPEFWQSHGGFRTALFVPQSALHPLRTLPR